MLPFVLQFLGVRSFFACFQVPSPPSFLRSSFVRQSPSPSLWPSSSLFLPSLIRVTRRLVIGWMWSVGGVLVSCALCGVTFVPCAFCLMCSGRASVSKLSTCKSTDTPLSVRAVCRTHCLLRSQHCSCLRRPQLTIEQFFVLKIICGGNESVRVETEVLALQSVV